MIRAGATTRRRATLHPVAWWLWAAALAVAASRTTNPVLLALLAGVVAFVVAARRSDAPWSRSLVVFFRLGLIVIALRVVLQVVFGNRLPGHVLFTLPEVPLPSWAAGVSIGGPVTAEALLQATVDGMRLAVILLCFGAANSLASPYRLLRCLPAVLYEAGVAVTVALTFAPELVTSIARTREARRLRGRPVRGIAGLHGLAVPVLESALDRSLQLAASMDARGYGRRAGSLTRRRQATAATAVGLLAVVAGVFGVLDQSFAKGVALPVLCIGAVLLGTGMAFGGARSVRTRYRPDRWGVRATVVTASGAVVACAFVAANALGVAGMSLELYPLSFPGLPLAVLAAALVGLLPAVVAPNPLARPVPVSSAPTVGMVPPVASVGPQAGETAA